VYLSHDTLHRLGLVDEAVRAQADSLGTAVVIAGARIDDHGCGRASVSKSLQHLEAIDARHLEIEDDAVDFLAGQHVQRFPTPGGDAGLEASNALQIVGVLFGHGRNVIDDENQCHASSLSFSQPNRRRVVPR
jgi:hypothetical protein